MDDRAGEEARCGGPRTGVVTRGLTLRLGWMYWKMQVYWSTGLLSMKMVWGHEMNICLMTSIMVISSPVH